MPKISLKGAGKSVRSFFRGVRYGFSKEGREAAKLDREARVRSKVANSGVKSLTKSEKRTWDSIQSAQEGKNRVYEQFDKKLNPTGRSGESLGSGNRGNKHTSKKHTTKGQSTGSGNRGNVNQENDIDAILKKVQKSGKKSLTKEERKIYNKYKRNEGVNNASPGGGNRVSGGGPGGKDPTPPGGPTADAKDISMGEPVNEHWWRNHLTHFGSEMLKNPKALATWVALAWLFDEHREAEKHGLSLVQELTGWATGYQYDEDGKVIGVNGLGSLLGTMASGSEAVKDGTGAFPQLSNELLGQQATDTIGDSAQWTVDTIQNGVNTAGQHLDKWVNGAETAASDGYDAVKDGAAAVKDHIQNSDGGNSYSYTDGADQGGQAAGNYSGRSAAPAGLNAGGVQLGFNPNRYAFDSSATVGSAMASLLARNPLAKIAMIGASGYFGNRTMNDYQGYQQNRQYSQQMQPRVEEQPTVAARGVSF